MGEIFAYYEAVPKVTWIMMVIGCFCLLPLVPSSDNSISISLWNSPYFIMSSFKSLGLYFRFKDKL
jgi:hypothetical protein